MNIYSLSFLGLIVAAAILMPAADGRACSVGGCGGGEESWTSSAQSFLNSDAPIVGVTQSQNAPSGSFKAGAPASGKVNTTPNSTVAGIGEYVQTGSRTSLFLAPQLLKPINSISEGYVVLDVSNKRLPGEAHIRRAIHIPAKSFLYENGTMRSAPELAAILGEAGISDKDAVVVYSDSFNSGEAALVLLMLRYLGQEDVQALDGGLEDWTIASLPLEIDENVLPNASYTAHLRPELLSDYDFIKSGKAQMVDARTFQDFGKSRIPNATFISTDSILEGRRIKEATDLNDTFATLDINRPVVVYYDDILNASLVWYALQLMGFDSRIYDWQDWQAREAVRL